jgi:methyl-accepting chemotaxis protein
MRSVFVTLAAIVMLCTLAVAATLAVVNQRATLAMAHATLDENAATVMDLLAAQLSGAVKFGRAEQIAPQVAALVDSTHGDAAAVVVVNAAGDVLAQLDPASALAASADAGPPADGPAAANPDTAYAGLAGVAAQAIAAGTAVNDASGAIAVPIRPQPGADPIGALAVRWSTARIDAVILDGMIRSVAISGAIFVTALVAAMLVIRGLVSRPLNRVTAAMAAVADGRLDTAVPGQTRHDEIGAIARTLAEFAARLAAAAVTAREAAVKGAGFSASSAGLLLLDAEGRVEHLSDGARRVLGARSDAAAGAGLDELLGLADLAPDRLTAASAGTADPDGAGSRSGVCDMEGRRLSWQLAEIAGTAGRIGFIAELRDDSERLRVAAVLAALDAGQMRAEFDGGLRVVACNDAFARGAAMPDGKAAGTRLSDLLRPDGDPMSAIAARLTVEGRVDVAGSLGAADRRIDGQIAAIRDDGGHVAGYILLARDVTEAHARSAADRAREAAQSDAQKAVVAALSRALSALSSGDLTARVEAPLAPDYDQLRIDLNTVAATLSQAIEAVAEAAQRIGVEVDEIASAADDLAHRTEHEAATLAETATRLSGLSRSVADTASTTERARDQVAQARGIADDSAHVVRRAVGAMGEIETSSHQISRITDLIHDIAFQTNLLALNAGVEAARAGEAGRGFAVVASEVRALAQRSSDAARDIAGLIAASKDHVATGVSLVGEAGTSLAAIATAIGGVTDLVQSIADQAAQQARGLSEVSTAVSRLDQTTQRNTAMFEHTSAATQTLRGSAAGLQAAIRRFHVDPAAAQDRPGAGSAPAGWGATDAGPADLRAAQRPVAGTGHRQQHDAA